MSIFSGTSGIIVGMIIVAYMSAVYSAFRYAFDMIVEQSHLGANDHWMDWAGALFFAFCAAVFWPVFGLLYICARIAKRWVERP